MRCNFRPEALNMALIPGSHRSTAQSRHQRKRLDVGDSTCSNDGCDSRGSRECGSRESFSGTGASESTLESLRPQTSRRRSPALQTVKTYKPGSPDHVVPGSPLDDALLRARRWHGLNRDAQAFAI